MTMTANELLTIARKEKPHVKYTQNAAGNAIAAWSDNRWIPVAGLTITGHWIPIETELLVNGVPTWPNEKWIAE